MNIYQAKRKIEKSPHYNEIVQMILKDEPISQIHSHFLKEYNEKLSKTALKLVGDDLRQRVHDRKKVVDERIQNRKIIEAEEQALERYSEGYSKVKLECENQINEKSISLMRIEDVGNFGIDLLNSIEIDELTNQEKISLIRVGTDCMKYLADYNQKKVSVSLEKDLTELFDKRELLKNVAEGDYNEH